jgi:ammonium transporter Rh
MAGTIFLFLFWPSFNSALAPAISQQRVAVNTTLSITASVIGACACGRMMHSKLDMEMVLNATLAGGVIIGAASDVVVMPGVAIIIGGFGGMVSAICFGLLSKLLRDKINLHDTCGVHNLHGIPGFLGGLSGAVCSTLAGRTFANAQAVEIIFSEVTKGRTFAA